MKELPKALIVREENTLKFLNAFGEDKFKRPLALFSALEDSVSVFSDYQMHSFAAGPLSSVWKVSQSTPIFLS